MCYDLFLVQWFCCRAAFCDNRSLVPLMIPCLGIQWVPTPNLAFVLGAEKYSGCSDPLFDIAQDIIKIRKFGEKYTNRAKQELDLKWYII